MSKSKGNVVDPDDMIAEVRRRRAAAVRDVRRAAGEGSRVDATPASRAASGSSRASGGSSITGPRRSAAKAFPAVRASSCTDAERALRRKTHETIRRVTVDIEAADAPEHRGVGADGAGQRAVRVLQRRATACRVGRATRTTPVGGAGRAAGTDRGAEGGGRGAGADAVAVRAAHGRGAVGDARAHRRPRRRRLAAVRRGGRQGRRRSSCRCRSTARCARG